jgi:hypothetical protein
MQVPGARLKRLRLDPDPAFGDRGLRRAREEAAMGGWEAVRDLLAATGEDWQARSHRISVLAGAANGLEWPRAWRLAEPGNPDAHTLAVHAEAVRLHGMIIRRDPAATDQAVIDCVADARKAAERSPLDPTPWISLLTLAGVLGDSGVGMVPWGELSIESGARSWGWFQEAVARHPESWHAHHRMHEAQLSRLRTGPPHHLVSLLDFATAAAAHAATDSPLRVLPLWAHTELRLAGVAGILHAAEREWLAGRNEQDLEDAYRQWFGGQDPAKHPAAPYDLNVLAYQLVEAGRRAQARPVFEAIGSAATTAPWAQAARLSGAGSGTEAFLAARSAAESSPRTNHPPP